MTIDAAERTRRRALIEEHYAAENEHDLERIMRTFSGDAVVSYNRMLFENDQAIRGAHGLIGMSASPGAFGGLRNVIDAEHYTDAEVVIEGRLVGTHASEFLGFAPTGRDVELPFVAFYRFDENDRLADERIVMNLGPLQP